MPDPVIISPYQTAWVTRFEELSSLLRRALEDQVVTIEHVGSTAVPGLDAKPIVDLDIVITETADFVQIENRLAGIGYRHLGDQGVPGRQAFAPAQADGLDPPDHHLYVCRENATELRRHLRFRDSLRAHPDIAADYARLKRRLAAEFGDDREAYTEGKTRFIEDVLERFGADR